MSFLRLKRTITEDPKEILVLASKKKKIENVQQDASIFELTGTTSQKDDIDGIIATKANDIRDSQVKKFNLEKITNQLRSEHLQRSKHNRLQVLNCIRKIEDEPEKSVTIIDVTNDDESSSSTEQDYVYDIYYSKSGVVIDDSQAIEDCDVHEINGCTWAEDANSSEEENNGVDDDDDSNDENNWRNDYPDEDYDLNSDEDDEFEALSRRIKQSRLSDDSLSSDDFDEDINDDLFGVRRRNHNRSDDIDYYDEVVSDEPESDDEVLSS